MAAVEWIELNALPHRQARALVRTGRPVYLLANPIEYHGPHLSLRNDHWISRGLAADLCLALQDLAPGPLLYGGELEVAVEPASGPGTRHTPFATVRALAQEACLRLAELGAERVVVMTFHGSPMHSHALWAGIEALQAAGVRALAPLNVLFGALLREDPGVVADAYATIADDDLRAAAFALAKQDLHAGFLETSLSLHYAPATVGEHGHLPPCAPITPNGAVAALARAARLAGRAALADELELAAFGLGWYALRPFPGYTSHPALANADAGGRFARFALARLEPVARAVLYGTATAPPPIMPWIKQVTLGGRLPGLEAPVDSVWEEPPRG